MTETPERLTPDEPPQRLTPPEPPEREAETNRIGG